MVDRVVENFVGRCKELVVVRASDISKIFSRALTILLCENEAALGTVDATAATPCRSFHDTMSLDRVSSRPLPDGHGILPSPDFQLCI